MNLPPIRRRFVYPSNDLVTLRPGIDRIVDRALAIRLPERPKLARSNLASHQALVVLGFPRSGNTFLYSWIKRFSKEHATVLDGRVTHSALDVFRLAQKRVPLIIPARQPIDTCASMMVRMNRFDDARLGRDLLEAHAAWHHVSQRALASPGIRVIPFDTAVHDPMALHEWDAILDLIDWDAAGSTDLGEFREQLRTELRHVQGQGSDQAGVPARLMISLPDPGRQAESNSAKQLLLSSGLASARKSAAAAFEQFMTTAYSHDRLVTRVNQGVHHSA